MPNGGSDNCNSCWFNERNDAVAGIAKEEWEGAIRCILRDVEIENTHWTYCSNHPSANPNRLDFPVGAVARHDGETGRRVPLYPSPDTPELRDRLVGILDAMSEDRRAIGVEFTAMKQLGLWKELTATGGLRRVLAFREGRDLEAAYALVALASVLGDGAEPDIELHLDRVRPTLERIDRSVDAELGGLANELLRR